METEIFAGRPCEHLGLWEVEVTGRAEADLHKHIVCVKNPGHLNFIPVDTFSVDKLPPGYHDNDIVDFVRAMAELTVRICVNFISNERPPTVPGSDKPYPGYDARGKKTMYLGTGWVSEVDIVNSTINTCICTECQTSSSRREKYANIVIRSAAHVIYDDNEGKGATCDFFFDKGSLPKSSAGTITVTGMSRVRNNDSVDFSEMVFVTHELDLAERLLNALTNWIDIRDSVSHKYCSGSAFEEEMDSEEEQPNFELKMLTIIVSHPHGCSKQVSIGEWIEKESNDDWSKYLYNTPTCSGSSGAFVLMLGREVWNWGLKFSHWGSSGKVTGLNESVFILED